MPRITPQNKSCDCQVEMSKNDDNLKYKILEDRIREDYVQKNMLVLDEEEVLDTDPYLFIYDTVEKKLKRASLSLITKEITDSFDAHVDEIITSAIETEY